MMGSNDPMYPNSPMDMDPNGSPDYIPGMENGPPGYGGLPVGEIPYPYDYDDEEKQKEESIHPLMSQDSRELDCAKLPPRANNMNTTFV